MRFEHGSHRTECLAALIVLLLLCCCCCRRCSSADCSRPQPPFGEFRRQCLPLDEPREWCGARGPRLLFCDAYEPARLLSREEGARGCDARGLENLRRLDEEARRAAALFANLLDRYDCENANSVSWTCRDCEEAYKQWVCAMFLPPVRLEGEVESLKPCRFVCRLVEQRCPYFHPSVKEQYAGERVFKCIDPDIPDLDSIQAGSSYGPPHRCYCPQHLNIEGSDFGEAECQLLSLAQLRRNASRWGHHHRSSRVPLYPNTPLLMLLTALLVAAWWTTRTR